MADEELEDALDETAGAEEEEAARPPEAAAPPPPPEPAPEPDIGADDKGNARLSEIMSILKAHGLHLPGDTTMANLGERICVAGHAKREGLAEDEDEPGEGEGKEPGEDEGATYPEEGGGMTVEEQRPVMMSLATVKDSKLKKGIARRQDEHRKGMLARVARLEKDCVITVHQANGYRERIGSYTLSLTEDWEPVEKRLDFELSTWDDCRKRKVFGRSPLKGAVAAPRPGVSDGERRKAQEEVGDELAEMAGAPARKK